MFQARATLNSIIENAPNQDIVAEAKQKLAKLEGNGSQGVQPQNLQQNKKDTIILEPVDTSSEPVDTTGWQN